MIFPEILVQILTAYSVQLPIFLLWVIGIILSLTRYRKHPRVSLLTTAALSILLISNLARTALQVWLPATLPFVQVSSAFIILGITSSILSTIAWAMLLVALFGKREQESIDS